MILLQVIRRREVALKNDLLKTVEKAPIFYYMLHPTISSYTTLIIYLQEKCLWGTTKKQEKKK